MLSQVTLPAHPVFAATDAFQYDDDGQVTRQYALVHVCATAGPGAIPVASDDAVEAAWVPVDQLDTLDGLLPATVDVMAALHRTFGTGVRTL